MGFDRLSCKFSRKNTNLKSIIDVMGAFNCYIDDKEKIKKILSWNATVSESKISDNKKG